MYDLNCARCGQPITEYRGSWFSRGDETHCQWGRPEQHFPDSAELLRKRIKQTVRSVPRDVAERILAEAYDQSKE